jgi:ABC-type phosphate/phosphonate transport system ATPase subunit
VNRLAVRGLRLERGGRRLVDVFDLDVTAGEVVAITGPSGCGKTTLLRTLAGLEPPAAGSIASGPRALMLQELGLAGDLCLFDAVTTGALHRHHWIRSLWGLPRHERQRAWQALDHLGLAHAARRKVRHCSGGERQRAALARLLVCGADLLLADEPVSNLDHASADTAMAALRGAASQGAGVVVVLHQRHLVERFCDRSVAIAA